MRNASPGDNTRKRKEIASKWVRHHNSILTTSQPEDNCEAANTRAERGCQGARCYCWKENFLSSASGCRNAIQKIKDKQLCRGECCPYLSNVHTTKVVYEILFLFIYKTKIRWLLFLNFSCPFVMSLKIFTTVCNHLNVMSFRILDIWIFA